jgi:hypothetical protein
MLEAAARADQLLEDGDWQGFGSALPLRRWPRFDPPRARV